MSTKTVLITGASSGFGEACARKFAAEGHRLILAARRTDRIEALARELGEQIDVLPLTLDGRARCGSRCQYRVGCRKLALSGW